MIIHLIKLKQFRFFVERPKDKIVVDEKIVSIFQSDLLPEDFLEGDLEEGGFVVYDDGCVILSLKLAMGGFIVTA